MHLYQVFASPKIRFVLTIYGGRSGEEDTENVSVGLSLLKKPDLNKKQCSKVFRQARIFKIQKSTRSIPVTSLCMASLPLAGVLPGASL